MTKPRSSGPRSNLTYYPFEVQRLVYRLLIDGWTCDDVRSHPEVAEAAQATGRFLHNSTLLATRKSIDYQRFKSALEQHRNDLAADKWAAEALKTTAGIDTVADLTQMELLLQLRELGRHGRYEPADLGRLVSAVTKIKASSESDQLNRLRLRLREREAEFDRQKAEYEARINALELQLAQSNGGKEAGLSEEALRKIEEKAGLL